MSTIHIIDYGMGNLRSIAKAIEKLNFTVQIVQNPTELAQAQAVILPGVGAFGMAMENLKNAGMIPAIMKLFEKKTPFLGICLGMQLLFEKGFEKGKHQGLGIFKGTIVPFQKKNLRIPHMGWNSLSAGAAGETTMFKNIPSKSLFYFVHSFFAQPVDSTIVNGWCDYGLDFAASLQKDHIWATQFHPEKSGDVGLQLLRNFCEFSFGSR